MAERHAPTPRRNAFPRDFVHDDAPFFNLSLWPGHNVRIYPGWFNHKT